MIGGTAAPLAEAGAASRVSHLVHPIAKMPPKVVDSVACIAACGSAESSVSAIGGSEGKSCQSAKGTRQHIIDGSSAAVSSFELKELHDRSMRG